MDVDERLKSYTLQNMPKTEEEIIYFLCKTNVQIGEVVCFSDASTFKNTPPLQKMLRLALLNVEAAISTYFSLLRTGFSLGTLSDEELQESVDLFYDKIKTLLGIHEKMNSLTANDKEHWKNQNKGSSN